MNGYPPPMPPPATLWKAVTAPDGRTYYHNAATNKTQWDKPDEMKDDVERGTVGTPWVIYTTGEGKRYFAHAETKETTWQVPEAVQKNIEHIKQSQPPPRSLAPPTWAGPPTHLPSHDRGRNDRDDYQLDRRDRDRDRDAGFGGDRPSLNFAISSELQFASPQEAEAAFMKVLKQIKVQPDWEWPQAVHLGIKDPNWRAIPEPEKREEAFRKYCDDLRAQEKHKEQDRKAKLRADFTSMLRSHSEIKYYTRWKTALPILEDETIFRSAKDDHERKQLFDEYIVSLKKAHAEKEAEDRKSALDGLMHLLQELALEPFTRWNAAEEKLDENEQFHNEKFRTLSRLDVLNSFETHIRQLQRDHNDRVQADRRTKYRTERKNRDAYLSLLNELREKGKLRAGTKWKEIHPIIEADPRYLAMLGQSGSSPLDLFWDALEEEEGKFRTQRRYALDVLENERFEVTTSTPFDEFLAVMRTDPRTAAFDDQSMKSIFEYVLNKVKRREENERRDEEHVERNAMDQFRSLLKRLDPPIATSDTWETIHARVENTDEFHAVKSIASRQSVFDKFMRRLKEKESDQKERKDRSKRDIRDRDRDRERDRDRRDRDRDREYRNGHSDSHRRHRTRTRSPEHDSYAAERRLAQQDREARYRHNDSTGLSPPYRRERRDDDRYERSRRSPADHYGRERREREAERERSYVSRADPREGSVSLLDYGDGGGRTSSTRRRRESDESASKRDTKRPRYSPPHDLKSKSPAPDAAKEDARNLRSGSEEGEIEED